MKRLFFFICALSIFSILLTGSSFGEKGSAFSTGKRSYQNKDYQSALKKLQRAVRENPSNAIAHYYLGLTHGKLGHHSKSAAALGKTIFLDPKFDAAYLSLGIAHYKLKSWNPALRALNKAIKADPNNGSAYFFRALTYQGKKDYRRAIPSFEKARDFSPEFSQVSLFNIGLAYFKLKSDEKAKNYFQKAIEEDPQADLSKSSKKFLEIIAHRGKEERRLELEAGLGWEYSDNVNSAEEDLVSGTGDSALVIEFEGSYKFLDSGRFEGEVAYDFFSRFYSEELSAFDFQSHSPSLSFSADIGKVHAGLSYRFSHNILGDEDFLQINTITPSVGVAWTPSLYTYFSYMYMDKDFLEPANDPRDAVNNSFGFIQFIFFMKSKAFISGGYRFSDEDATGDQFDYTGHQVNVGTKLPLPFKVTLRLKYKYLTKDYTNVTPSIGVERQDDKQNFKAELSRDFFKFVRLKAKYEHINNDSNLPSAKYVENIGFVGLSLFY